MVKRAVGSWARLAVVGAFGCTLCGGAAVLGANRVVTPAAGPKIAAPPDEAAASDADLRRFVSAQLARLQAQGPPTPLVAQIQPHLSPQAVLALAAQCAPATPSKALVSIAQVESGLSPLTLRVNGAHARVYSFATPAEAADRARLLIGQGHSVDLGLAQVNSHNLGWLGLSVEDAFDPCRNLAAAARILDRGYAAALTVDRANRSLLQMAYSIYNTGGAEAGWRNGYVARIETARRTLAR